MSEVNISDTRTTYLWRYIVKQADVVNSPESSSKEKLLAKVKIAGSIPLVLLEGLGGVYTSLLFCLRRLLLYYIIFTEMYPQILISILVGIILGFLLFYVLSKWGSRGKYEVQSEVPRFSEKEAEGMLRKAGYQIRGKQQRETVITNIDGKDHFGYLEADYTVCKGKKNYVVIVKTGEESVDPNEPTLRRRLLEYDRVFSPNALLVLDLNRREIHKVNFRFPRERNIDFIFQFLIGLFIILLVIGIIWLLVTVKLF